jgi:lysosomal acid phosphatase
MSSCYFPATRQPSCLKRRTHQQPLAAPLSHPRWPQTSQRLLVVSSHYNTQLGLLAALQLDRYDPAEAALPWLRPDNGTIPTTAAVLALELHQGQEVDPATRAPVVAVRLVAQDGPTSSFVTVPLPCSKAGDAAERTAGLGACKWAAFVEDAAPTALRDVGAWCDACGNSAVDACQARAAALAGYRGYSSSGEQACQLQKCGVAWKVAVAVVVSVVGTAAVCGGLAAWLLCCKRRKKTASGFIVSHDAYSPQLRTAGPAIL